MLKEKLKALCERLGSICEKIKGWRTVAFNAAAGVVFLHDAIMTVFTSAGVDPTLIIPEKSRTFWMLGYAIANVGLRYLTSTPVGTAKTE